MRRTTQVLALAGLAFLLCSSFALAVVPAARATSAPSAPALVHPFPDAATAAHAAVPAWATSAAPTGTAPASSADPSGQVCQTPGGAPNWQSSNFFTDAAVTFWTPGNPSLSGQNFLVVPCNNNIPTYTNGFWMNVTTNVELTVATVTIWGTGWPTATDAQPDLKGFSPATPAVFAMNIAPPFYRTASFYFNDYRYFWPGSQVYFNISLSTTQASPGTIYSANPLTQYYEPIQWSGGVNNATWGFYVASPFAATPPGFAPVNFSNIIGVSTTPTVLGSPSFEPNPKQTVEVTLTALNLSGGPAIPIPEAQGTFTLTGAVTGVYFADFGPANHTTLTLSQPLGPYPGTKVQFNMTCWLPWEGGALDRIYSPTYTFNWSANGSWWDPTGGLTGPDNLNLTSSPDVTAGGPSTVLATGTSVNISIHEPIQNVTIGSAAVHFRYVDTNGVTYGTIPMVATNWNTSYAVLPGLPSGAGVTFSVVAKDIYGDPLSSGNYSYTESGPLATPLPAGYGLFFFEAIDVATGNLVQNLNFTIANATWSESALGYDFGFANPVPVSGAGYLDVAFGTYTVTARAFGQTQTWTGTVATQTPFVVVFYLTSAPVSPTYSASVPGLTVAPVIGIIGAAVASVPISNWFRERRRKAEAEQRRISL
jgi:hypothetical protein